MHWYYSGKGVLCTSVDFRKLTGDRWSPLQIYRDGNGGMFLSGIIKTVDLRKVYKIGNEKVVALDCINLEIQKGEVCCILGTSGSGKSTLLNQLAGLEKPTRGEVYIKDEKISVMSEKQLAHFRQRNVGFVFQSYNLLQGMSAIDNVAIPLTFRGMAKRKRLRLAKEMLAAVGLAKRMNHTPSEMSGGQQQRVGIARAFVAKPDVVFADEPTGNLDTRTTREVMDQFLRFAREKQITIVLVTHDQNLARYADRIVTIVDGFVVGDKLNHSLYEVTNELREQVRTLCASESRQELARLLITYAREYGDGVTVQAYEDCLKELPDQQPCIDAVTSQLTDISDRQLFHRIGIEIGYIDKNAPPPTEEDILPPATDELLELDIQADSDSTEELCLLEGVAIQETEETEAGDTPTTPQDNDGKPVLTLVEDESGTDDEPEPAAEPEQPEKIETEQTEDK